MRKILFVYEFCNLGGVSSVLKQRSPLFEERECKSIFLFDRDNGGRAQLSRATGLPVHIGYDQLDIILEEFDSSQDIVVLFDAPFLIGRIRDKFKGRIVLEIHSSLERALSKISINAVALADITIVPSKWSRMKLTSMLGQPLSDKIMVVPNFVDQDELRVLDEYKTTSFSLIFIGKIHPDKNYADFIRVAAAICRLYASVEIFIITGGTAIEAEVQRFLNILNYYHISERTRWLANLTNAEVGSLLRGAASAGGVLVSTSKYESFGLAVLEAMACSLPVAVTSVCAIPELFGSSQYDGLKAEGDIEGICSFINRLFSDPEYYERMRERVHHEADRLEQITSKYNAVDAILDNIGE